MAISTILVSELDPPDGASFDGFVRESDYAAYQQSRAWAQAAPAHGRRDWLYFLCLDDDRPIGAAVIRRTRLAMGYWLATVQRGPVVHDPAALAQVLPALRKALRRAGCCSVQIGPRVRGRALPAMAEAMRADGFVPLPADRQPLHVNTGIVWLDKPEDAIIAGFKQRGRRAIRAAEKDGITVRPIEGAGDIATAQALLDTFAAARPDYDTSGQLDAAGQAMLVDRLGGAMLLAERGGGAIGVHAFVRQADEAIWLSLATLGGDRGPSPGYALLWDAMRRARAMGCVGYDLAGLPAGEPADAGEAGRVQFKTAFDPHRRILPPMQVMALAPLPHALLFGARQAYRTIRGSGRKPAPTKAAADAR